MRARFPKLRPILLLLLAAATLAGVLAGCGGRGLPAVKDVNAVLIPGEGDADDVILVTWQASRDSRVDGYVIYRAEQAVGASPTDKSEFVLQALTFATQYRDDDIRVTDLQPAMRYYYGISVISADGETGPMSSEVAVDYTLADQARR